MFCCVCQEVNIYSAWSYRHLRYRHLALYNQMKLALVVKVTSVTNGLYDTLVYICEYIIYKWYCLTYITIISQFTNRAASISRRIHMHVAIQPRYRATMKSGRQSHVKMIIILLKLNRSQCIIHQQNRYRVGFSEIYTLYTIFKDINLNINVFQTKVGFSHPFHWVQA